MGIGCQEEKTVLRGGVGLESSWAHLREDLLEEGSIDLCSIY